MPMGTDDGAIIRVSVHRQSQQTKIFFYFKFGLSGKQ